MKRRPLASLLSDREGAVAPMIAALGVSLIAAAGLALDVGLYQMDNRDLRAATEAAALAAAMNPAQAEARARDYLGRNGLDPTVLQSVTIGRYCADSALASGDRFDPGMTRCPGNGATNAVRIVTRKASRRFLTRVLGDAVSIPDLAATATAARIDEAGIEVSSGIVTVTNALVNSVNGLLGALVGVNLTLSTAEIEALMGGNVDAGLFFDSLARRVGHDGTYGSLVQGTYRLSDIAQAAADAAGKPATAAALRIFATQVGTGYQVPLKDLFGLGVWKNMPVGEADAAPALRAGLNAYQLVSYAVQSGPAAVDLSQAVSLLVPVSTVKLSAVSSTPTSRPRFAFGPAGETSVATSALRLRVLVDLPVGVSEVASVNVHLPILIDVASAQAEVTGIACPDTGEQARDSVVAVQASSGLVRAYVGDTAFEPIAKPMPAIGAAQIQTAAIAQVQLFGFGAATVKGRAIAEPLTGVSNAALAFGPGVGTPSAPIAAQTVGNQVMIGQTLSALTTSLLESNGLTIELLGACLPIVCAAQTSVVRNTVLPALVAPVTNLVGTVVDPLLNNVLTTLGIQLGHATVWVNGARCGVPVLV